MNLPRQIESIEHNYHEDDAIAYLERWYDEWSKDEDWWGGGKTWDLNVFTEHDAEEFEYGSRWVINVYGLVKYGDDELLHIDTSNEIDVFELKL
tara:strand:- start:97 stop:378 length:282 start_codon:yes stop_codon:yes gene_type:complete